MPPKAGPPRPGPGAGPHLALGRLWASQVRSWPEMGREHGPQRSCLLHNRASLGRANPGPAQFPSRPGPTSARSGPVHEPGLGRPSRIWVTRGLVRASPDPRASRISSLSVRSHLPATGIGVHTRRNFLAPAFQPQLESMNNDTHGSPQLSTTYHGSVGGVGVRF